MVNKKYKRWIIVVVSFLIEIFVFATCMSCMGIYTKPVAESFGISRALFSMAMTVESLVMMVAGLVIGKLITKHSVKLLMSGGVVICSLCLFAFSISTSIIYFYFSAAFMGAAVAFSCNVPISYIIKNWFEEGNQGLALGITFVGSGAGAMILTPLYSHIIETSGWRFSFVVAGVCVLLLTPLVLLFVSDNPDKIKNCDVDRSDVINNDTHNIITLGDAVKMPCTWLVFIGVMFVTFSNLAVLNHGIPFMTDYGIDVSKAAMIISVASGFLIVGKIIMGIIYDKLGTYKTSITEVVLIVLCILALCIGIKTDIIAVIGVFIILYGFGFPISSVGLPLIVDHMFKKSDFGAILGFYSMAVGIAGMLQILVSLVYDMTGSYYPAWIGIMGMCIIAFFLFKIALHPQSK